MSDKCRGNLQLQADYYMYVKVFNLSAVVRDKRQKYYSNGNVGLSNVTVKITTSGATRNDNSVVSAIKTQSSPPSAAYMRQWIGSALVQIMALL